MNMDTQIRVRTETRFARLYNDLRNLVVGEFHELFFVCASLGHQMGRQAALVKPGDRFWSSTISPREWSCYYAIALESSEFDYEALTDDRRVIALAEEYANGGMQVLIENFLGEYLLPGSEDEPQLDVRYTEELPKHFIHFLYDRGQELAAGVDASSAGG
ncbi:MAG: hypothetical protein JXA57_07025 [Armatimonadetes bacterium]|nr:hypothetical protein [Armatimonadota bacterium]